MVIIRSILLGMMPKESANEATAFDPDYLRSEESKQALLYFAPLMEQAGLIRKIAEQADFAGLQGFRVTWKGHCFLDLFDIAEKAKESENNSFELTVAQIALVGFF